MTIQEAKAKEVLNNIWDFADAQDEEKGDVVDDAIIEAIGCMEEVEQYRALGTVEELKEAREKQIPMKIKEIHVDEYYCPACGSELNCNDAKVEDKYCSECGQNLKKMKLPLHNIEIKISHGIGIRVIGASIQA